MAQRLMSSRALYEGSLKMTLRYLKLTLTTSGIDRWSIRYDTNMEFIDFRSIYKTYTP